MIRQQVNNGTRGPRNARDARLAAYLAAAGAATMTLAQESDAAIVANKTTQTFGINGDVNIDFNLDGQIDFQIDHDRYDLNDTDLDYLQIDKNDVNGASNPLPIDSLVSFPVGSTAPNDTWEDAYVVNGQLGSYPVALTEGSAIGPGQSFDFQEGDNFDNGKTIRANRLIDEDQTQIDKVVGGLPADKVVVPFNGPNFLGLGGAVRYLGLKMDLNNADADGGGPFNYGWIGIRIDDDADATGAVVGYGYQTDVGVGLLAGETGSFVSDADYDNDGDVDGNDLLVWQRQSGSTVTAGTGADGNGDTLINSLDLNLWRITFGGTVAASEVSAAAIPEPPSLLMAGLGAALLACWLIIKRGRQRLAPVFIRR